ncbi:hypothetical protein CYMTET_15007 [Cymbomonas tetramitiformis]|uniref:Uncharacterized protein n=1 Tax=Cymbomonas tetramitiformis TaxID=36881 RepID=A0AAE0GF41_9CHLO|nr:hypothetical protein CYMTET_15007 [Cymbomonas tetramitiformis]
MGIFAERPRITRPSELISGITNSSLVDRFARLLEMDDPSRSSECLISWQMYYRTNAVKTATNAANLVEQGAS